MGWCWNYLVRRIQHCFWRCCDSCYRAGRGAVYDLHDILNDNLHAHPCSANVHWFVLCRIAFCKYVDLVEYVTCLLLQKGGDKETPPDCKQQ